VFHPPLGCPFPSFSPQEFSFEEVRAFILNLTPSWFLLGKTPLQCPNRLYKGLFFPLDLFRGLVPLLANIDYSAEREISFDSYASQSRGTARPSPSIAVNDFSPLGPQAVSIP